MTIETDLGTTRESARRLRFEKTVSITATNVQKAIEGAGGGGGGVTPPPIVATTVGTTPYAVLPTDTYLYVRSSLGPITIQMPVAADRAGIPLVIKDIDGQANAIPITILPGGGELIDSLAAITINTDFGGYQLNPRVAVGYTVNP